MGIQQAHHLDPDQQQQSTRWPFMLTRAALAEFLGISERQVYTLVKNGVLPQPRSVGDGSPRWVRDEVEASMRARPAHEISGRKRAG